MHPIVGVRSPAAAAVVRRSGAEGLSTHDHLGLRLGEQHALVNRPETRPGNRCGEDTQRDEQPDEERGDDGRSETMHRPRTPAACM